MDLSKVFSTHSSTRPKSIVGIFFGEVTGLGVGLGKCAI